MTLHEDLAIEHMHKMMSSPEGVELIHDYYTGIRERWSRDYVDLLGQHQRREQDLRSALRIGR